MLFLYKICKDKVLKYIQSEVTGFQIKGTRPYCGFPVSNNNAKDLIYFFARQVRAVILRRRS